jgi:cytochrome c553
MSVPANEVELGGRACTHPPLEGEGRSPQPEAEGDGEGGRGGVTAACQLHPTPPAFAFAALGSSGDPPPPGEGGSTRAVRRTVFSSALALLFALQASLPAHAAGNVAAGRSKALQCQTCHGLDGLSKLPEAPHIAGQPEPYLVKSLNDYRKGVRTHDMMTLVVRDLTDQDVADLAAYYAAIEFTVKPPAARQ